MVFSDLYGFARSAVGWGAIVVAIITIWSRVGGLRRQRQEQKDHHYTWEQVEKGAGELVNKMNEEGFRPKTIIAVGRGGAVLMPLIADHFRERPQMYMVDRKLKVENRERIVDLLTDTVDFMSQPVEPVLLVEGKNETGGTIEEYTKWLRKKGVDNIKSAALVEALRPRRQADFIFKRIALSGSLHFPWNNIHRDDL